MKKALYLLLLCNPLLSLAQRNNAPSSYDPHDIKITGYLQAQFQKAQSSGAQTFSGGDFTSNSDSRFMIRRGRLKIDRVDKYTSVVFQIDGTQNGVQLMDAFMQIYEPNHRDFMLTAGLFNRPFGHSIVYSSGYRDFPERARVFQTIMPQERDLGAMGSFHSKRYVKFLTAELAVVNGSGLTARDYDSKKDIIGNLGFSFDSLANKTLHIGFGGSIYQGYVRRNTATYYTSTKDGYVANTDANNINTYSKRDYYGANLQIEKDNNFGKTIFKAEYVSGKQPGVGSAASITGPTASRSFSAQPATNIYERNFNGYYFWLTQQIGHSKLTALAAYDVYDPNTDVKEDKIGAVGNNTTAGDIKFNTLGYGLTYQISSRIKLTVYNEHVKNNKTQFVNNTQPLDYAKDLKDDVFTARLQYRW